jgi:tetratricopeptide (TPR) repeat protein/transcription elongation GreA/GreB family factor
MTEPQAPRRQTRSLRCGRARTGGGRAASLGPRYQASVAAFAYVAIVTETPLPWFGPFPKVPTAVSGETGGPGDDLRVEFGLSPAVAEVQARHSMNAAGDFVELVADIAARSAGLTPAKVALVVDRRASDRLYVEVAKDLDRVRDGQFDQLGVVVKGEVDAGQSPILANLFIAAADFDEVHSAERAIALEQLRHRLEERDRAEEAWALLVHDGLSLAAEGRRRDAPYLTALLHGHGIRLRPPERDEAWLTRLEFVRTQLLDDQYAQPALSALTTMNGQLERLDVAPRTRASGRRLLAVAFLALERAPEAKEAARRAVELDDSWSDAHATYAHALVSTGETALAATHADRAVELGPDLPRAWIAKIRVADASGSALEPPAHVASHRDYRTWLVGLRRQHGLTQEVLDISASLLSEDSPTAIIRFFHAEALVMMAEAEAGHETGAATAQAELTALIDSLRIDHPVLAPAHQVRSRARKLLGDVAGQIADEETAQRVNRDDPVIVRAIASARALRGDFAGALQTLQASVAASDPDLLAIRAGLLAAADRKDEARRDIEVALANLAAATDEDRALYAIGSIALDLGDLDRARDLLARLEERERTSGMGELLAGEISFAEGDTEAGKTHYANAANAEPDATKATLLRVQLGMRLLDTGAAVDAMATFREIGFDQVPNEGMRAYAIAALQANDMAAARDAVDRVAALGQLPTWALSIRADIGLRTEDPAGVLADTLAMEAQGAGTGRVNLTMARSLIELGRKGEARERVGVALAGAVTPMERAEAASYLRVLDDVGAALVQAFLAYREDRGNPNTQRLLAALVFTGGVEIPRPETVGIDGHVTLRRTDGQTRDHSIFGAPPVEKATGELTQDEAAAAGLLGLRVGDVVGRDPDSPSDENWEVIEIVPAIVHAARRIASTFADSFPTEPFFMRSVRVGDLEEARDWAPLISILEGRKERVQRTLALYHEQVLPFGLVASFIGVGIPELMLAAATDPFLRPLHTEWIDQPGYQAAVRLAGEATTVVATRSGLFSARRFGLLDLVARRFDVVVPTSLMWELREEVDATERMAAAGSSTMLGTPAGPRILDLEPNHPDLVRAVEDAKATLQWVEANTRQMPRPLSASASDDAADRGKAREETRMQLGPPSFDAAALAEQGVGALYADDLGLRRFDIGSGRPPPGFSTIALVEALTTQGSIESARANALKVDLILAGYAFVTPTIGLLEDAIRRMPGLGRPSLEEVFSMLGTPLLQPFEAARLIAQTVKATATQAIEVVALEVLTELGVLALAKRLPRAAAARLVKEAAQAELRLLPIHLQRIERSCDRLAIYDPPTMTAWQT